MDRSEANGMTLIDVEHEAEERLAEQAGGVEAEVEAAAEATEAPVSGDDELERSPTRVAIAVALPTIAAALMVGGIFSGAGGRIYAAAAGVLGVLLALAASRIKNTYAMYAVILGGLFAIAVAMVVPSGVDQLASFGRLARTAAAARGVLRPPVQLTPGWQFIIGGLMGFIGFVAGWLALVVKRPALGVLIPLPMAAIAGISVPKQAQIPSGIAVLALFAIGLGVLSTAPAVSDDEVKPPLGYELRRAGKGLIFVAVITGVLIALAQAHILFPKPLIDPTMEPQKPHTIPPSDVIDRPLFRVKAPFQVQWRLGSLDVYDGTDWRLPPFAASRLKKVPKSGVLSHGRENGLRADFTVVGLTGAILPTLPATQGIVAVGPPLSYDTRNGNIRLTNGQVESGFTYTVVAPSFPTIDDLRRDDQPLPDNIKQFTQIPSPPPAVQDLMQQAKQQALPDPWSQFDFMRNWVLDNITATGPGVPSSITPARVQEIMNGKKEGSPFEIVAMQAMFARWVGVPSRIGYGYDHCDQVGDTQECRPKHAALFPEVYFPGYDWLPVVGKPKKAKPTVGAKPGQQQTDADVVPSDELSVQLFLPVPTKPASVTAANALRGLIGILILALLAWLGWLGFPFLRKSVARTRRRNRALDLGPRARVALAYADWRDWATDYGYAYAADTPLMFVQRFPEDEEHREFAWLVTRCLWGDMQEEIDEHIAASCEELSRSLRRRLAAAHPGAVRFVAAFSRLSQRNPYSPSLHRILGRQAEESTRKEVQVVPVTA